MEQCYCKPYKTREYFEEPSDYNLTVGIIRDLVNRKKFEKTAGNEADKTQADVRYGCTNCGSRYHLVYRAGKGGWFGPASGLKSKPLAALERYLIEQGITETYRGKDLFDYSREGEWVGFDVLFDPEKIRKTFSLGETIEYSEYNGLSAGSDSMFLDTDTNDAVLGRYPHAK